MNGNSRQGNAAPGSAPVKKFVAVVGNQNSGKSTIIQSLTGCPTRTYRGRVTDMASGKEIEVIAASPQERPIALTQLAKVFRAAAKRHQSAGVVMAIQPTKATRRPRMEVIVALASRYGLSPYAFLLAPGYGRRSPKVNIADVKGRLAASGASLQILDGTRFAHLNASVIRDTVGLF